MKSMILEFIMAFVGSFGFGLIFHIRKNHIFWASFGGLLAWAVYRLTAYFVPDIFFPTLMASMFSACYAECLARIQKAPATLFSITAVIPLIPGGPLYYTLRYIVQGEWNKAGAYGYRTAMFALGIAVGIGVVAAFWEMIHEIWKGRLMK